MPTEKQVYIPPDLKAAIGLERDFCNVIVNREMNTVYCIDERTENGCRAYPEGGCCLRNTIPSCSEIVTMRLEQEGMILE